LARDLFIKVAKEMPMSNNAAKINAWFERFEQRMDSRVPHVIAETATEYFQESFQKQSWDNQPWQPLSPSYAARKTRSKGRILTRTAALQRSIRPTVQQPAKVTITAGNSKVRYARVHNEGLRVAGVQYVRPHKKGNFMGKGKPVNIKGHSRKVDFRMPRRQFMGHSAILNREIITRLRQAFSGR
jgi:phage gpG-like protein